MTDVNNAIICPDCLGEGKRTVEIFIEWMDTEKMKVRDTESKSMEIDCIRCGGTGYLIR